MMVLTLTVLWALLALLVPAGGAETGSGEKAANDASEADSGASEIDDGAVEETGKVLLGRIDGDISLTESAYVTRLIEYARIRKAAVIALELNTFGGRVDAAVAIRDALLDCPQVTVVFINKRAISAGALISLACKKIAISPGGTIGAATPIITTPGQEMPEPVEEKYLSYFREEMRVTAETNGRNGDIAEAMVDASIEIPGISEKDKLLTLTTRSALEHGIADVEAISVAEALEQLGYTGAVDELERSWSEHLVGFLTSTAVASLLFMAMLVLGYLEYQTPGFGVFGISALICFLLLYFSHYLVNLAGWEELLLFLLGVVLLIIEVFVTPGFGALGASGLLCILVSVAMLLMAGDWSDLTISNPFTLDAAVRISTSMVLGVVSVLLLIRFMPISEESSIGGKLVLTARLGSDEGFQSHRQAEESLLGAIGVALTPLRPAGKARFDGVRLNVESEGDFIARGARVKVLRQTEGRIVVRKVEETAEADIAKRAGDEEGAP